MAKKPDYSHLAQQAEQAVQAMVVRPPHASNLPAALTRQHAEFGYRSKYPKIL
jgi:hypothetical protein